jgi:hypothetical protein
MPDDYLAIVDGAMVAGYHLGNALLHVHGLSADCEHTNTPSKLERGIDTLPAPIQAAFGAFAALEKLRFDYVRSASVYDPRVATEVWRCLEVIEHACAAH